MNTISTTSSPPLSRRRPRDERPDHGLSRISFRAAGSAPLVSDSLRTQGRHASMGLNQRPFRTVRHMTKSVMER